MHIRRYCFDCGATDERGEPADPADLYRTAAIASTYARQERSRPPCEPGALIAAVTEEMHRQQLTGNWEGVLRASEALLHLLPFTHGASHPKVAMQSLTAGLAALRVPRQSTATSHLSRAVQLLRITHGEAHPLTISAVRALATIHDSANIEPLPCPPAEIRQGGVCMLTNVDPATCPATDECGLLRLADHSFVFTV